MLDYYRNAGKMRLSIAKLDKVMRNYGAAQFNYETFKSAYDSDPRLKEIVKNFDQDVIELSDGSASDELNPSDGDTGGDNVSKMAKSATDLGADL